MSESRRDVRVFIYAGLDLVHLAAYIFVIVRLAPPLGGLSNIFWLIAALFGLSAGGMLGGAKWGRRIAVAGCTALLVAEIVLLGLILSSAAFLAGVYGSFGRGGAGVAVLAAFLSIQIVALVPGLQLKFLLTRAGKRAFGCDPR